jgi:hypothetical protein
MNDELKYDVPKTNCDLVTSKSVYIDGKKVGGVLGMDIKMSMESLKTEVIVRFAIKNGSLHITDYNDGTNRQKVEFSTINEAFK